MARTVRAALLCALPAFALPTAAPAQSSDATLPSRCNDQAVEPARVVLACADAGFYADDLAWTDWGASAARAEGTAHVKRCDPDCATDDRVDSYPVVLVADRLRDCSHGEPQYTRVRYEFPGDSPFPPDAPGTLDPYTDFPCPRPAAPRPRLTHMQLRFAAGASRFTTVTRVRLRLCAQRGIAYVDFKEHKTLGGETHGADNHEHTVRQRRRCQWHRFRWQLKDEFFGVGTYKVTARATDADLQLSNRITRRVFTSD
jgi:hypothetical protein